MIRKTLIARLTGKDLHRALDRSHVRACLVHPFADICDDRMRKRRGLRNAGSYPGVELWLFALSDSTGDSLRCNCGVLGDAC